MIVKLTSEQIALIGATSATDFTEKFIAFVQEAKELKDMADQSPDISAFEKRIKTLEDRPGITEARVTELAATSVKTWAGSDDGKKIIGAEASRITLEAIAAIGTKPAKPSPAAADDLPENKANAFIAQGKFEEAWAISKELQSEFPTSKCYAAFAKANGEGRILFNKPSSN